MLSIFSKLTQIKSYNFGMRCFATLKSLMLSGKDLGIKVLEQIKKEVIPKLKNADLDNVSIQLLKGLTDLVNKQRESTVVKDLIEVQFSKWFEQFLKA